MPNRKDAMPRKALLLINLGTPVSTDIPHVRAYLREFLSDPRVIDINPVARWLLLNLAILPFRPAKSAEAYRQIWTEKGSPLLVHTRNLAEKIQKQLGGEILVDFAMRYQKPSISSVLSNIQKKGIDHVIVLPLFPQYSAAASGSAVESVFNHMRKTWNVPHIEILSEFYQEPEYLEAFAEIGFKSTENFNPDKFMFSFHGLPERHCRKSDETPDQSHCFSSEACCDKITAGNRRCYRAQCVATARGIATAMKLPDQSWEIAFQSRLGRTPWVKPYTDERIALLPKEGIKRLAVFSPAFVSDCLETLEEIAIRAKEDFIAAGGEDLLLIPSLNAEDVWVNGLLKLIKKRSALIQS